jgi:hypothetical protein
MNTILFETKANKRASDARLAKSKKQVADQMVILVEELESLNEQLIADLLERNSIKQLELTDPASITLRQWSLDIMAKREQDIRMEITNKKNYLIVLIESQAQ